MLRIAVLLASLLAAPAFAATTIDGVAVDLEKIGEGFSRPVEVVPLPGDGRLLVVEKTGTIRFIEDGKPGAVFLDLSGRVSEGNEQGLLGLAFDPQFATSARFYVNYTDADGDGFLDTPSGAPMAAATGMASSATGRTRTCCWARSCASMPMARLMRFRPTIRSPMAAGRRRCSSMACAIRGATRSTAICSTSPMWDRMRSKRSTSSM